MKTRAVLGTCGIDTNEKPSSRRRVYTHGFRHFLPRFFQPEYRAVSERRAYLKDTVKVVQTPRYIGYRGPLLYRRHPGRHTVLPHDFRSDQLRQLVEPFGHQDDVRRSDVFVVFHPSTAEKFSGRTHKRMSVAFRPMRFGH